VRHWRIIAAFSLILGLAPVGAAAGEATTQAEPTIVIAQARGRQNRPPPRRAQQSRTPPKTQQQAPPAADAGDGQELRRGEKVEFDARLIQGQTAKAGAVFLFERVSSDLSSMVKERRSYRQEIIEEVFPQETNR